MRDIWLISDTHFGHENIIKYCNRPFSSAEEMDEYMVARWNEKVKDGDIIYHLGDIYMRSDARIAHLLSRLKGRKRLVIGNHDIGKDPLIWKHFEKIMACRIFKEEGVFLSHIPVHPSALDKRWPVNVHGHIHEKDPPGPQYVNISVEKTGYAPVNLQTVKWFVPVPFVWANNERISEEDRYSIQRLREAGCKCRIPLLGEIPGVGPRCRTCGVEAKKYDGPNIDCPKCGAPPRDQEVVNYDPMWHDGDVVCTKCGTRVRGYDAG